MFDAPFLTRNPSIPKSSFEGPSRVCEFAVTLATVFCMFSTNDRWQTSSLLYPSQRKARLFLSHPVRGAVGAGAKRAGVSNRHVRGTCPISRERGSRGEGRIPWNFLKAGLEVDGCKVLPCYLIPSYWPSQPCSPGSESAQRLARFHEKLTDVQPMHLRTWAVYDQSARWVNMSSKRWDPKQRSPGGASFTQQSYHDLRDSSVKKVKWVALNVEHRFETSMYSSRTYYCSYRFP